MQKFVSLSYLLCNFHKRGSLELLERFTEHLLGGECSLRILPFNQINTKIHEITGSKTDEFN